MRRFQAKRTEKRGERAERPDRSLPELHHFVVQKPFCAPCRDLLLTALNPYGIPVHNFSERVTKTSIKDLAKRLRIEASTLENVKYGPGFIGYLPMAMECEFDVSAKQASWAEYLIESTNRLIVVSGSVNRKNRQWGNRRNGKMPVAWDAVRWKTYSERKQGNAASDVVADGRMVMMGKDGEPWIEEQCTQGRELWKTIMKAAEKGKRK